MNVKILRITLHDKHSVKAFVDLSFNDEITIRDFKIIDHGNGKPYVAPPRMSWGNRSGIKYKTLVTFSTELRDQVTDTILALYRKVKGETVNAGQKNDTGRSR